MATKIRAKQESGLTTVWLKRDPPVQKLLEHKPLEEGERYELIPIEPEGRRGAEGPQPHSTPRKKAEPLASVLTEQVKQLQSQELQQLLSAVQIEMRSRQDTSISPVHEVSSILHTLLKDGALRTNIPKLSAFSGERAKGEVSFEQWSYELQTLRKTYSDSALREGIQHSLRGAAADTVRNMGPDVPLDTIIKKFTIVYGNVKSFDLLMRDFYHVQIRGKRSQSLPLQQGLRDSCPRSMINSQGNLLSQRNRDSSRIACSMDVRKVSGTVSSTALLILA